ncbi:MAG: hypothetical protein PHQ34_00410 [Methanothrix sp.]|nr:hypothetical protein [Methanothrix sp.]
MHKIKIDAAIERGIDFLVENQLDSGEFPTRVAVIPRMEGGRLYNSPFVTSFVLYSVKGLRHPKLDQMIQNALCFLQDEQEEGGIWRFHTKKNLYHKLQKLPPDLDDISVVSHILKTYGVHFDDNHDLISGNLDQEHRYLTWIGPSFANDVDCVVNANVLLYLGENDQHICTYINNAIRGDLPFSKWYFDKLFFYYIVSRAFENGITDLNINKDIIIDQVLRRQRNNGSFGNDLHSAFAMNILHNFNFAGNAIEKGTEYMADKQNTDGSWDIFGFCSAINAFYGSKALTTALALEALNKYLHMTV